MKQQRTIMVIGVALLLIIVTIFTTGKREVGNEVGMVAENFTLPTHEKGEREFAEYEGQVIVLNFWASWCEPCRDEMPALMELQEDYQSEGLEVVTVNAQKTERTLNDAPAFIEEMNLTLPVFFDENGEVYDRYGLRGLPTTFVINREGIIEQVLLGEVTYSDLEEHVVPLF
ncbi:TlpA disulfide reductase family protein [Bacillus sp. FJAT-45037]|uniref:TlpA disulfide reductase family protein n=1 Tax=Bacillus sp. FJAT-45037 TaxID=2011007 RepID=UPI000C23A3E6|nr:TlpA disulfide reductase family protein [Bacillus sp. FJAT-45037]